MKPLDPVPPPYIDCFDEIVAAKKEGDIKNVLVAIRTRINSRFIDFETAVTASRIDDFQEDRYCKARSEPLLTCYNKGTKPLKDLKRRIEQNQSRSAQSRCFYCGISHPGPFDHYMPKRKFPDLAVHPLNLVPCCTECNQLKGGEWAVGGGRSTIHPYSDPEPRHRFLHLDINQRPSSTSSGMTFRISKPGAMNDEEWEVVRRHFETMKLIKRYNKASSSEFDELFDCCMSLQTIDTGEISRFVRDRATRLLDEFGYNYWRGVMYETFAQHRGFLRDVRDAVVQERFKRI